MAVARVVWIITSRGEEHVGIRGDTRFPKRGRMPERLGGIHFTCRTARKCQILSARGFKVSLNNGEVSADTSIWLIS